MFRNHFCELHIGKITFCLEVRILNGLVFFTLLWGAKIFFGLTPDVYYDSFKFLDKSQKNCSCTIKFKR
jgi:hypothetical protein